MKFLLITLAVVALLVGGSWAIGTMQQSDPDVISQSGIHWHPTLEIFVRGEKVDIPANIGLGQQYSSLPTFDRSMGMTAIHTHEDMPVIHLEFPGLVREEDITLGRFFEIWGKDIRSFGESVRMTVGGAENTEYEKYIMRDGDTIQLHYD